MLTYLQEKSKNKSLLKSKKACGDPVLSEILERSWQFLSEFTLQADKHIEELSVISRFDKTLSTTRDQYHLYMLEIELTNRISKKGFLTSEVKFAFLPHCFMILAESACLRKMI